MTEMEARTRILLADDHTLLLQAFRNLLRAHFEVCGTAADGESLVRLAIEQRPDVIVADVSMPGLNGLRAAELILAELPATRVVFLTMSEDAGIAVQAFRLGAVGYVLKSDTSGELVDAIQRVAGGGQYLSPRIAGGDVEQLLGAAAPETAILLTPREREVVRLLASGNSMPQVARTLGITPRTVAFHKYRAMETLGAKNGGELIALAVKLQLI
jgi:DNA-binding NarL/FixJ family response regulator